MVTAGSFDLADFHDHLATHLPDYAQPLFLRLTTEIATTTTFKHKKAELAAAGYDPASAGGDALYVRDPRERAFVPLDATLHQRLLAGELRL